MRHPFRTAMGILGFVTGGLSVTAVPLAGQTPVAKTTAVATTWTPPRTAWGDPDLQGVWNSATSTPLQRVNEFGEKTVLTEEEFEEFVKESAQVTRDLRDGAGTDAIGPDGRTDVARAYNEHWNDSNTRRPTADRRTSLIVDPPDGRIPPLVARTLTPEEEARRARAAAARRRFAEGVPNSYLDYSLPVRCIIRNDSPPYVPTAYNNNFQIFQSPGYVVIAVEMIHSARVIPVDGRAHLGVPLRQWLGDPRGRWDGNTLVVETTNFRTDDGVVYQNANPKTFRIVERFTRVDADMIQYEFTVSDPQTWTRPWTAMLPWNRIEDPNHQVFEYACHEDNYDAVHLLTGGRIREKAEENAGRAGTR